MQRPRVITIAGLDPSGGAGLTADIKTLEAHNVHGMAVCTAHTLQTESEFESTEWRPIEKVLSEIEYLMGRYKISAVKVGITRSAEDLSAIVSAIRRIDSLVPVIVDPVWRSSTGFEFNTGRLDTDMLRSITLITPNMIEFEKLTGGNHSLITDHTSMLLKGGHNETMPGADVLYCGKTETVISPGGSAVRPKHGSGCVLSSAIAALMAQGYDMELACRNAKLYTEKFLSSHPSLTGIHAS